MGLVIPRDTTGRLQFAKSHIAQWTLHKDELGLSQDDLDVLAAATDEASDATNAADQAKNAARSATIMKVDRNENLQRVLSILVRTIKATAAGAPEPSSIYSAANIRAPKSGSTRPAPDAPRNAQATLRNDGTVRLKWRAKREGGVVFLIDRQPTSLDGRSGEYSFVAAVQSNEFVDLDVPCGVQKIMYRIRAQRGDRSASQISQATVVFGVKKQAAESSARLAA